MRKLISPRLIFDEEVATSGPMMRYGGPMLSFVRFTRIPVSPFVPGVPTAVEPAVAGIKVSYAAEYPPFDWMGLSAALVAAGVIGLPTSGFRSATTVCVAPVDPPLTRISCSESGFGWILAVRAAT